MNSFLQLRHMNAIVYLTVNWQLELVSYLTNFLENEIRSKIFETEFVVRATTHRLLNIRLELYIHPIPHLKCSFLSIFFSLAFHFVLCSR